MGRVRSSGDPGAFSELVRRWAAPLQRLGTRLTGDAHHAEDLVQEIFVRLFTHRHRYRPDARFSTWLWRLALNHIYSALRQPQLHREQPADRPDADAPGPDLHADLPDAAPAPDEAVLRRETCDAVRRALAELPQTHRVILVLRHYEGLKFREIAEVLDLPEGTVKTRLTEALHLLARPLARALERPAPPPAGRRGPLSRPTLP